jgi:pimeloyl-ACP methyl ester carboxylesterase
MTTVYPKRDLTVIIRQGVDPLVTVLRFVAVLGLSIMATAGAVRLKRPPIVAEPLGATGFGRCVGYCSSPEASAGIPADKRYAMAARPPKIALGSHATTHERTRLEDFRAMTVPPLLLHGTSSPALTRHTFELLASILAVAELMAIGGVDHMASVTHPDQVNALVAAQLYSHSRPTSHGPAAAIIPSATPAASAARADA